MDLVTLRNKKENVIHFAVYSMARRLTTDQSRTYSAEEVADWAIVLYRTLTTEIDKDAQLRKIAAEYDCDFK